MLTKFSLYNESETKQWDEFVESHPKETPYHLSTWLNTLQETYSFGPLMYVVKDTDHKISGIFPFFLIKSLFTGSRIVSLPFTDQCGPLFNDWRQEKDALAEIVEEHDNHVKYIEIRAPLAEGSSFKCHNYYKRHVLELSSDPSARVFEVTAMTHRGNPVFRGEAFVYPGAEDHLPFSFLSAANALDFHGSRARQRVQNILIRKGLFRAFQRIGTLGWFLWRCGN